MRLTVRFLRRLGVRIARGLARRARAVVLLALAVVLVVGLASVNVVWLPNPFSVGTVAGYRPAPSEPPAISAYLRGQQTFDARLVWESYSDRVIRDLLARGASLEETQQQLDRARENGTRIEQVHYIGSHQIPGGSIHFYVLVRSTGARGDVSHVPYAFTLDADGKIERVE